MSSFIPLDLQINILERLPVKTLVRCTAVCKSWYSVIKNPTILKPHLMLSSSSFSNPQQEGHTLFMPSTLRNDSENKCVVLSQDSFVVRETFSFNFTSNDQVVELFNTGSCCNGVICLPRCKYAAYGKEIFLFNPSIRKLRRLPSSLYEDALEKSGTAAGRYVGFGYDQITDDYKVVKVYRICKSIRSDSVIGEHEIYKFDVELQAEVYSLRSGSWKTVQANDHRYLVGRSVSVNNSTYWLSSADDGPVPRSLIVAFDFSDEVFRDILLPIGDVNVYLYMLSYKGSLALLQLEEDVYDDWEESGDELNEEAEEARVPVSLWIMEYCGVQEYSWSMEFTKVIHRSFDVPIQFTSNGKLIFKKQNTELAAWDPESGLVVDLVGFSEEDYIIVEDYIDSLILI